MKYTVVTLSILTILCVSRAPAQGVSSLVITEFLASNTSILADGNGEYSDWIEIHNPTASEVVLAGCYLTDDETNLTKWVFPAAAGKTVPANGYLIVMASGNADGVTPYVDSKGYIHTSFKLSAAGESVLLVNTDGVTVISSYISYPEQGEDVSYGLGSNAITGYLRTPTPAAANGAATTDGWVADTHFDVERGFYTSPFTVAISCATSGATIKYTLDCSAPGETSGTIYTDPINITGTTVLRAMAFKPGWISTDVDTQTYIFVANTISQPATPPGSPWPNPTTGGGTTQAIDYGMDTKVTSDARYSTLMDDALLAIPTIAIVTDPSNLFAAGTGIYSNPETGGLECPASVELLNPDGTEGFHVNAGLRLRGGTAAVKSNPKHSLRIVLRAEYGDDKILYPLFGAGGADKYDKLDLRAAQNFSWHYSSPQYCTFLDDPFTRDTMRDMGHMHTRGFFFHLYLDGVYWGMYQTEERPEAYYAQSYLGGDSDDYDAVRSDEDTGVMEATDGTIAIYNAFWTQVNAGVSTNEDYFRLQGMNPDGTANTAYSRYLDVDNLIDYMLVVFFTGAQDMPVGPPGIDTRPRNLWTVANHVTPDGFKWITHDNEWSLRQQGAGVYIDRVTAALGSSLGQQQDFNPWWLHSRLMQNPEYVLRFADHVHRHFFNGGALTPAACTARYQARIDEISTAVIAESARWGDYLNAGDARTKDDDWLPAVNWVKDHYFNASPQTRTAIVLSQLQGAGLYPTVAAPEFSQHGGTVSAGFVVTVTAPAGTIYYTVDGSDPRQIGGSPGATAFTGSSGMTLAIPSTRTVKARAYNGASWSALAEATFTVTGSPSVCDWWQDDLFTTDVTNPVSGATTGWTPFSDDQTSQVTDYDAANQALRVTIAQANAAAPGARLNGWMTANSEWMPYSVVGSANFVRCKFHVFRTGQAGMTDLNQIPNMRLRLCNRFAVNSMLELFNHLSGDPAGTNAGADIRPSVDPTSPSIYRVDFDPVDVAALGTDGEGVSRGFEAYCLEPQENGSIELAESAIGTYPAAMLPDSGPEVLGQKVFAVSASDAGDLRVFNSVADGPFFRKFTLVSPGVLGSEVALDGTTDPMYAEGPDGVTLDTLLVATNRVGVVTREFTEMGANTQRVRVEPGRQYKLRWHVTSITNANRNPQLRLRARALKFMWSQKLEIGGALAAGTTNNLIAQQALPGVGSGNPDQQAPGENGGWYTVILQTPMSAEIRDSQPYLGSQPGPGAAGNSVRDIKFGFDAIDTLSGMASSREEKGVFTLDRIELRSYQLIPD